MHSDMITSAKAAYLIGRAEENIQLQTAYNRLRNVHKYLSKNNYSGDCDNNLIILGFDSPTDMNKKNFLGHLFYGIDSRNIESVISNGNLIVDKRKLVNKNEDEILEFSREMSKKLWNKLYK
jgi:hypothetical protein